MLKNKTKTKTLETPKSHSDFSRALTRITVAQICQSIGYTSAKSSALETLTKITSLYLKTLTTLAASNADRFGRTESNLLDVVVALEDLESAKGFWGASDLNRGLLKSQVLDGVIDFVDRVDEIPFAQAIRRDKVNNFKVSDVDCVKGVVKNVPIWLPRFPESETYKEFDKVRKFGVGGSGEVLFPNGKVEEDEVLVSGEKEGKSGCGELQADRCRVKFRICSKAKGRKRLEVDVDVCGKNGGCVGGEVKVSLSNKKGRTWKEEKKVYVRRRKGLLSKSGEKEILLLKEV